MNGGGRRVEVDVESKQNSAGADGGTNQVARKRNYVEDREEESYEQHSHSSASEEEGDHVDKSNKARSRHASCLAGKIQAHFEPLVVNQARSAEHGSVFLRDGVFTVKALCWEPPAPPETNRAATAPPVNILLQKWLDADGQCFKFDEAAAFSPSSPSPQHTAAPDPDEVKQWRRHILRQSDAVYAGSGDGSRFGAPGSSGIRTCFRERFAGSGAIEDLHLNPVHYKDYFPPMPNPYD